VPLLLLSAIACDAPVATSEALVGDPHGRRLSFPTVPESVACSDGAEEHVQPGASEVVFRGLLADTAYTCVGGDQTVRFTTDPLPENLALPELVVPAAQAEVGYRLTNVWRNNTNDLGAVRSEDSFLVIFDAEGRPRWQLEGDFGADTDVSWVDGKILVGGFSGDVNATNTAPTFLDLDGETLWAGKGAPMWEGESPGSWHHDVGIGLDGTHVHALAREYLTGTEVQGFVIHAVSLATGDTDWFWSAELDGVGKGLPEAEEGLFDPWHANAVWEAEEDGARVLWVSLNEIGTIIRIDVATKAITDVIGADTGWTIESDVSDGDIFWFARQHDVKVIDGSTMYVFDNGERHTRVMRLDIDRELKTATIRQSWSEANFYVDRWGGADPVGSAIDVARPHWLSDDLAAALVRVEEDGTESWRVEWPDSEVSVYRSETIPTEDIFARVE
jgi:Arylsulfotransferase (ASST)